jgi:hypothetical protein
VILVFQSDRFRPYLPDDCQVNPNVLGFELAEWLSRELARRGTITSYPISEDWGWFLEREVDGTDYMICCSGEADDQGVFEWRVYVSPVKRMFQRPKNDASADVLKTVRAVLEGEGLAVTEDAESG